MHPFVRRAIAAFLFFHFIVCANAQTIDTSPLDAYWKMIEPLKHGDSLSVTDWYTFLKIEANHVYIDNQGFDSAYLERVRKNIQYVYMPKYDSLLQARLLVIKKDPSVYWNTYKVYVYKANEEALRQYEKQLQQPGYVVSLYTNAWPWLPKHLQQRDTSITIHFLGIENDAIAGNSIIIATAWSAFNQDKLKMGILGGHEMHHVLRKGIAFSHVADKDKGLLYVLNSILNEGTADMVDKPFDIAANDQLPYGSQLKDFELYQADSIVKQIDTSIINMAQQDGKVYTTEKQYRNLIRWSSGHCPGYYMTDIIVRNGYKRELLEHIQNPFYFVYLYNKAAKKDAQSPPVFSAVSIAYIEALEKKYWVH